MLLVNVSNLYTGGGLQTGISVIEEFTALKVKYIAAISPPIFEQLSDEAKKLCVVIKLTPSGLLNFSARKKLTNLVQKYQVTDVFTVFGPSYWIPKVKNHLVGFAQAWIIYDTTTIIDTLSLKERIKRIILNFIQKIFFKYNATKLVTETNDVRRKIISLFKTNPKNIFTVSNAISSAFYDKKKYDYKILNKLPTKNNDIWLLTIAYDYPHKNLKIITKLINKLPYKFKFILTVNDEFKKNFSKKNQNRIITLGKITNVQCPPIYEICDALFLPTLLECFSASYIEAMYMEKPIFTSNKTFAKAICKNAAYYFNPLNIDDISKTIINAYDNKTMINKKCLLGKALIKKLPSAKDRAKKYLNILYAK
ncbi:glycosyltransferase [Arsenophonus endosymbiont of Lipoptena cervi]|uniref:glycosyltransferase n=1 Tax=Arsenophonus endosymbiont of Lipoptena cervi TaxID=363258 RepID=UPI00376F0FDE